MIGGPYGGLVALAWPALFLSLAWNFLEYALQPPEGEGIVWGWLIPGVLFVLMGGVPWLAGTVTPWPRPSPVLDAERAEMSTQLTRLLGRKSGNVGDKDQGDLVSKLERLCCAPSGRIPEGR